MGLPNPRLAIEYYTNDPATFGPKNLDGIIHDASAAGWSWYSRFPANAFFTLRQGSVHNARLNPLLHHIRVWYVNDETGVAVQVFNGRLSDPDSRADDVVWTAWNYLSELSLSRSGYRTLYPTKAVGSEIVSPEWVLAKGAGSSLFGHVVTGTIEDPLGTDGITVIKTDNRFGVIDVPRLLMFFDLTEIGRANTVNNVVFEITRTPPFTFNFWKNRGGSQVGRRLTFPGSIMDYRFLPGYAALRNDLATIGTSAAGGAVEIVKGDTTSQVTYGRRQDVFTIKTLAGQTGAANETDAQNAITARAVKEATQLSRTLSLDLRNDLWEPFQGWDLEDTVRVQIARGRDSIDADYRIVGARGVMDQLGYHPQLLVQLPTAP